MISVDDPKRLLDPCKRRISSLIGIPGLGFNSRQRAPSSTQIWELNGYWQSQAETPKKAYHVLPLVQTRLHRYWLSAQLTFAFSKGEFLLSAMSISVFEGEHSDSVKNAILRAEWAVQDPSQRTNHAQPHWHVYASRPDSRQEPLRPEDEIDWLADPEGPEPDGLRSSPDWPRMERFHFAMASQWHDQGLEAHFAEFSAETLLNWIDGCLTYIKQQLLYLDGGR